MEVIRVVRAMRSRRQSREQLWFVCEGLVLPRHVRLAKLDESQSNCYDMVTVPMTGWRWLCLEVWGWAVRYLKLIPLDMKRPSHEER